MSDEFSDFVSAIRRSANGCHNARARNPANRFMYGYRFCSSGLSRWIWRAAPASRASLEQRLSRRRAQARAPGGGGSGGAEPARSSAMFDPSQDTSGGTKLAGLMPL
eukprot:6213321-Pleurochrysis_carterae.AAC.3